MKVKMSLKKSAYFFILTSLAITFPLSSFSENINKKPFKISANKKSKTVKSSLIGSWKDEQGLFSLIFISNNQLEFNGDKTNYTLKSNAIRVEEEVGQVDYRYILKGNNLSIEFPDGNIVDFYRVVQTNNNITKNKKQNNSSNCNIVYLPSEHKGGCHIRLITPANCEEIDLSNGKTYQFAWQTGGTFCETPFKLYIAGNPVTEENTRMWQYSTKTGQISRTGGGYDEFSLENLSELRSDNGIYHWVVTGWFGSHPNSQTFRIKR
jgi:hypothetical protein